jgi:hypothetical protein
VILDRSIERQARRALYRMVFWRLAGELFSLAQVFLSALQVLFQAGLNLFNGLRLWFNRIELAVFCLELDAARKYKLLTGVDMGTATHETGRYAMLDPERADAHQRATVDSEDGE